MLAELLGRGDSLGVLCVVAHCDDETILCGGLLARAASQGARVRAVVMCGHDAARKVEFMAACDRLGITGSALDYRDGTLPDEQASAVAALLTEEIRANRPALLVTHDPEYDYNPDHLWLGRQVAHAAQKAGMSGAGHRPELVIAGEIHIPIPWPDYFVDVTTQMPTAIRALECHESQLAAAHKRGFYTRLLEARARWRGVQAGCDHAMAFRRLPLPVIGDLYGVPPAI